MSNQEAIALLRNLEDALDSDYGLNEKGKTMFRMAIEALSSSEFPNSSDAISRQQAIEAVQNRHMMLSKEKTLLIDDIEKLPPAQIHCKDCKYYQRLSESCRSLRLKTGDEWYCADAERKVTT